MDDAKFWEIVAKVDWPGLCAQKKTKEGKERLLKLLPSLAWSEEFSEMLSKKYLLLSSALEKWEYQGRNRSFGVSDDGFSDLINHIIGCGQEHYEAVLKDPSLAHARARAPYGSPEGYTESFAYCVPYKDDYDSVEKKLARAQRGLNYWFEELCDNPDNPTRQHEVARRTREVVQLEAIRDGVTDLDLDAEVERRMAQTMNLARRRLVGFLEEELASLQAKLDKARAALKDS